MFVFACPHALMNAFKENRAVTDAKRNKGGKKEDTCHGKAGKGRKNWRTVCKVRTYPGICIIAQDAPWQGAQQGAEAD